MKLTMSQEKKIISTRVSMVLTSVGLCQKGLRFVSKMEKLMYL